MLRKIGIKIESLDLYFVGLVSLIEQEMNKESMVKVLEMLQEHRDESLGLQCFSNCSIMEIIGALNECTNDIVDPEIRNNLVLEIYQMDGPEGCFPMAKGVLLASFGIGFKLKR
ncbi:MAG: hypothetical protein IPN95_21655 [Bacteroidetes bacterium]|nr:hypothetical protein [Bacteroidota bacterium]